MALNITNGPTFEFERQETSPDLLEAIDPRWAQALEREATVHLSVTFKESDRDAVLAWLAIVGFSL